MSGLAILCPGQGSQHPEMFEKLLENPAAKIVLKEAEAHLGWTPNEIEPQNLFENRFAQPILCAAQFATWKALELKLPPPTLFAGYSVGELAAYGCAGSLDLRSLLTLATERARLMDRATPSGMLAVKGISRSRIDKLCQEHDAHIAIINGPDHFVLGADREGLGPLELAAQQAGGRTVRRLAVDVASHTPFMTDAAKGFGEALRASCFVRPKAPVLAGVNGTPVRDPAAAIATLSAQLAQTLNWAACLHTAVEMGCRTFLELGPGTGLTAMVQESHPDVQARAVDDFRSLKGAADWAAAG